MIGVVGVPDAGRRTCMMWLTIPCYTNSKRYTDTLSPKKKNLRLLDSVSHALNVNSNIVPYRMQFVTKTM